MRSRHAIRTTLLGIVLVSSLVLTSCGTDTAKSGCGPCYGGTINDAITGDPSSLLPGFSNDAFAHQVQQAIWAPLFYTDDQMHIVPALASEVPSTDNGGLSADATTLTIHLRTGLQWSDGVPLKADDVVFTVQLFQYANVQSVTKVDDQTVRIVLTQPDASFLGLDLTNVVAFAPLPQHKYGGMTLSQLEASAENNRPSVTSGPFMVTDRQPDTSITVSRNPHYYLAPQQPYLDKVVFRIFNSNDPSAVIQALQTGQVDVASLLSPSQYAKSNSIPGIKPVTSPNANAFEALFLNQNSPILQDHAVREALAISIDPHEEIQQIRQGIATPTCDDSVGTFAHEAGIITAGGFCKYGPDGKTYDPTAAGQLLDQDGWVMGSDGYRHKGVPTLSVRLSVNASAQYRVQSEQIIVAAWKVIGVQTIVANYTDSSSVLYPGSKPISPTYDVAEIEWFVGPDPDSRSLWDSNQTPPMGGFNFTFYSNPQVDMWEAQQAATLDPTNRAAFFHMIHQQLLTDIPLIYLYAAPDLCDYCVQLHNYHPSGVYGASETWNIQDWWYPTGNARPSSSTTDILGSSAIPIYGSCRGS